MVFSKFCLNIFSTNNVQSKMCTSPSMQECTQKGQELEDENKKLTNHIVKMEQGLKVLKSEILAVK